MGEKILIVEDDLSLGDLYKSELEHHGYRAFFASNGGAGITLAKKEKPDLILVDIMLPGMDGFSFIRTIRDDAELAETPVIILTNLETSDVFTQEGKSLGVAKYLIKYKTSIGEVVKAVKEALAEKGKK